MPSALVDWCTQRQQRAERERDRDGEPDRAIERNPHVRLRFRAVSDEPPCEPRKGNEQDEADCNFQPRRQQSSRWVPEHELQQRIEIRHGKTQPGDGCDGSLGRGGAVRIAGRGAAWNSQPVLERERCERRAAVRDE